MWLIVNPGDQADTLAALRDALLGEGRADVAVLLRAKQATGRRLLDWAKQLRTWTARSGSALIVHGRADVAVAVGAEGVHLAEAGLPVDRVCKRWPGLRVGVSRHDHRGLDSAQRQGAHYAFLSPVFEVPTKNPPLGIGGFQRVVADTAIPVIALGGIAPEHVGRLREAGAHGIAAQRAVFDTGDPRKALDRFLEELDSHPENDG